ncbi:MAG: hypothetical protein K2P69_07055 [Eubacterium sp.]|nr:hypothetical protein [Eubacterium sp.]
MEEGITEKELITVMIDKYTDLQRIKKANGDHENTEFDYQLKVIKNKLSALGIPTEEYEME